MSNTKEIPVIKQQKYDVINDRLFDVRRMVTQVEILSDRISGTESPETNTYVRSDSLENLLNTLPNDLEDICNRLNKAIDDINNKLF